MDVNHSSPRNARFQGGNPTASLTSGLLSSMDAQAEQVRGLQTSCHVSNRLETDHACCWQLRGTLGRVFSEDDGDARLAGNAEDLLSGIGHHDDAATRKGPMSSADPAYVEFYYANRALNPRLPPPTAQARSNLSIPPYTPGQRAAGPSMRADRLKP